MVRKFTAAAVAVAVLALAAPAGAANDTRRATFTDDSTATLGYSRQQAWHGKVKMAATDLAPGRYGYLVFLGFDFNGDGLPDGGAGGVVCTFDVPEDARGKVGCKGSVGELIGPEWGDVNTASIVRLEPPVNPTIYRAPFV